MKTNARLIFGLCGGTFLISMVLGAWCYTGELTLLSKKMPVSNDSSPKKFLEISDSSITAKPSLNNETQGKPYSIPTQNSTSSDIAESSQKSTSDIVAGSSSGNEASFTLNGQSYQLHPNQVGAYPQIPIGAKQKVPITVLYANGYPGQPIVVQVDDGGGVQGNKMATVQKLSDQLTVNFTFQSGTQNGIYRVSLFDGSQTQRLNFWLGPPIGLKPLASK